MGEMAGTDQTQGIFQEIRGNESLGPATTGYPER